MDHAALIAALDGEALLDDLEGLARIGAGPGGGVTRLAFSQADQAGRAWVRERMAALGLSVRADAAGNTVARLEGAHPELPPIVLGSHTDTVPDGGRYDGALGVLGGLAAARTLAAAGARLRHPLEIVDFTGEEATVPGGTIGSRAMVGQLGDAALGQLAWDGRALGDLMRDAGLPPADLPSARRAPGSVAAYLELHIEQGGVLEASGEQIGAVEGIVGIRRYTATFRGSANHAGTTPMPGRADALVMAAPLIGAVPEIAVRHGLVGTVGTVHVEPNAPNVIPGLVRLGAELRGLDDRVLDAAHAELERAAADLGGELHAISRKAPVRCDPRLVAAVEQAARGMGLETRRMPSGAGHDAMCVAEIGPVAMIFVPSAGGVSHAPQEYTSPEQCVAGARVLLAAALRLDDLLSRELHRR